MMKLKLFFSILIAICFFSFPAFGQNTPGTLNYPSSLDNQDTLFRTSDKAQSTLSAALNSTASTVPVTSAATFPNSGAVVIDGEIVFYTGKSGNNLTGAIRGASGTTAASHLNKATVRGAILAVHHNTQSQAIINVETKLGTGSSTPTNNSFLAGTGTGSSAWRSLAAADITSGVFNTSRLGSGTADNTKFLRGDGTWAVPAGGGGGISSVLEDASPELGGDLTLGSYRVGDASASDLTKLQQLTATSTELNYVDGVTSAIQPQLDSKANLTQSINALTGTTYTLQAADKGKTLVITNASAITLTVPAGLGQGFWCNVIQGGAGKITFTASSTTINNFSGETKTAGQYAATTLLSTAANAFILSGQTGN